MKLEKPLNKVQQKKWTKHENKKKNKKEIDLIRVAWKDSKYLRVKKSN